mmetsp:Transcript_12098/g.18099  ORF Transcript_12098/g.18099 Transcript_12098/m.18099 type:complete len:266 (-) Transcript_12098:8-805(-)|eukprot:CAMPEP_0171453808 /NCGR_PEP_ID=MMETSP0945-20130129/1363_1 /TAXON_ID=109269 /ORGANISM="Vaucheria litorea, Strain CCMP2940" /LENGTH=265 /DNA_ID=CAMNT_0011978739 /DNA_START=6 /DNA_END=803 /DNA_ORIENTATION=-
MENFRSFFGKGLSLYEMIGVDSKASDDQIKKAYYKFALKCHPDKCRNDPDAKSKFQALSKIHKILTNPESRSLYDDTGEIGEESEEYCNEESYEMWYEYYRNLFPKIRADDIESFAKNYKGSEEEKKDVLTSYKKFKGNMNKVMEEIFFSEKDGKRINKIIDTAIQNKEVTNFPLYKKTKGRASKKASKDKSISLENEAEESIANVIRQKRKLDTNDLIYSLERKYMKGNGEEVPDIDDDEFNKIQAKLVENKQSNSKKTKKKMK